MRIEHTQANAEARQVMAENYKSLMAADLAESEVDLADRSAVERLLMSLRYDERGIAEFAADAIADARNIRGANAS